MPKSINSKKTKPPASDESHDSSASDSHDSSASGSDDDPNSYASRARRGAYRETAEEYQARQAQASAEDDQAQASDDQAQAQSDNDEDLDSEPLGNLEEHDPSVVISNQDELSAAVRARLALHFVTRN